MLGDFFVSTVAALACWIPTRTDPVEAFRIHDGGQLTLQNRVLYLAHSL